MRTHSLGLMRNCHVLIADANNTRCREVHDRIANFKELLLRVTLYPGSRHTAHCTAHSTGNTQTQDSGNINHLH